MRRAVFKAAAGATGAENVTVARTCKPAGATCSDWIEKAAAPKRTHPLVPSRLPPALMDASAGKGAWGGNEAGPPIQRGEKEMFSVRTLGARIDAEPVVSLEARFTTTAL